jgi:hypothetical protein
MPALIALTGLLAQGVVQPQRAEVRGTIRGEMPLLQFRLAFLPVRT